MLLPLVQLFLIVSLVVFAAMPVVFVVLVSRRNGRGVLVTASFVLGVLAAGWLKAEETARAPRMNEFGLALRACRSIFHNLRRR